MNEEERKQMIEKLKGIYKDNEKFEKKGKNYHRFVMQKIDIPKDIGKPFLNIMYDKNNDAYVVLNVLEGMTKEEKEKRAKEVAARREKRRKETTEFKNRIKQKKQEFRVAKRKNNFSVCEELLKQITELESEYSDKFGRKKKQ